MSAESEEPNLFLRNGDESEECNDEWDDAELITAYEKTVSAVKRRITRKIQKELGLKDEDIPEFLSDAGSSGSKSKKDRKGKGKKNKGMKWGVGSSCRAVYSEDGKEYEAVVVKTVDSHWCIVRYVGYENEEEVMLDDLIPSLGKNEVQKQIAAANKEEEEEEDMSDEDEYIEDSKLQSSTIPSSKLQGDEVPIAQMRQGSSREKIYREREGYPKAFPKRLPMSFPLPPPPPVLPGMMSEELIRRQNDIDCLLMSWYMCGYYTGLYQRGQELPKN